MKYLAILFAVAFTACAAPQQGVQVVEINGPEVVDGPCYHTGIAIIFIKPGAKEPDLVMPLPIGCRCSIKVDGKEYVKTEIEETLQKCIETHKRQNGATN